jgi:PAS domain S-box-containing protein
MDRAARGYPVFLIGRVTFVDDLSRLIVIEDDRAAIRIDLGSPVPPLQVGNKVSLRGITAPGEIRPRVLGADLRVLDTGLQLPPPQPLSADGIRSGALEYRRVAVAGVQRTWGLNRAGRVVIGVETPAGLVQTTSFAEGQDVAPRRLNQRLRFTGVLRIGREATGETLRAEVWVGDWQKIELDEPASPERVPANGLPVLQTVAEIRRLTSAESPKGYPVSLKCIVTDLSRLGPNIFVQDSTGGVYARDLPAGVPLRPGDRIDLQGHTVRGSFLTDIEIDRLSVVGHGPMPAPAKASVQDMVEGRHRVEWVQMEGIVQSVQAGTGSLYVRTHDSVFLELLVDGVRIPVSLHYPLPGLPLQWLAARVRAQGVCASDYNRRRQFLGIRLNVPDPEFITVLEPAPTAPPPERQVAQLLRPRPGEAPDVRVRVRGIVTHPPASDLGGFYLQDETGGVFVRALSGETIAAGDEVEATGFPELGKTLPLLQATGYRHTGRTGELAPVAVLPEEAMRGDYDSQLIRVRGSLSTHVVGPRNEEFTLQWGNTVFSASLDRLTAATAMDDIRPGSLIEVTGVCRVEADRNRVPESFSILLRSPRDVVTIRQASWWNRERALAGLALIAAVTVGVFAWVLLLRKRVREQTAAIAIEKERYRSLVDHAPDIVFGSDLNGNLTSVNPAAELLLGYTQSELVGRNIWDLLPADQREAAREHSRRLISGESPGPRECSFQVKGGGMLAVEVNAGIVRKDGHPVAIHGILRDVTERHRLEDQLRQAQKMEAIGRLAGGVAHDFNNLLTVIMGNTMMLQKSIRRHGLGDFDELEAVIKASETAADLTRQLLYYSGKGQFLVEPVDLSDCIHGLRTLLRAAVSKNVEIRMDLAPDLPAVESDRGQIKQIVTNLALNSAEAIGNEKPGVIRVTTRLRRLTGSDVKDSITGECLPAGTYVAVEVSDTGCGMDAATTSRIFDPFFTTKFTGRGLGLPAVAGAVKAHGGGIELETTPGGGSRFCVLLPASARRLEPPPAPAAEAGSGSGSILVVDDELPVRDLAVRALSKFGYEIFVAADGRQAIEVFEAHADRIDAVLLDMSMPVLGGKQALAAMRARRQSVPVVLMSGYSEDDVLGELARDPQLAFLHKPFSIAELSEAVRSVMPARDPD